MGKYGSILLIGTGIMLDIDDIDIDMDMDTGDGENEKAITDWNGRYDCL